ncbi:unnamed protein product, partial [Ixodes hexagonus]
MRSSIRRMAASVANLRDLILETVGSRTPAFWLYRTSASCRSRPTHLSWACVCCLGAVVVGPELGHQVSGVLGRVHSQRLGDHQQGAG